MAERTQSHCLSEFFEVKEAFLYSSTVDRRSLKIALTVDLGLVSLDAGARAVSLWPDSDDWTCGSQLRFKADD